jgi:carboxypeptidase C (cathepsin A)
MTPPAILRWACALLIAGAAFGAVAQDRPPPHRAPAQSVLRLLPPDSVTEHSIDTAQGKLAYTATAGTLPFFDQSGEQSAAVFYVAYVAKDKSGNRPLTFVFNGGPGAASAYLHLGLVGPRILDLNLNGRDAVHATLHDNPDTWLRFTDLVMIDPIGTGWSRAAKPDEGRNFWNVEADAGAMAKAIALYVTHNNRFNSPKYLLGESYGGFRAAKTARAMQREQGMSAAGILMLSPLVEGWLTFGDDESALGSALTLPSLAAAELERKNALTPEAVVAAENFALGDYLTTLAHGAPKGEAARVFYQRVAQLTGLPFDVVEQQRGFITGSAVKTLRRDKIVSRYDADFAVDDPFPERRSSHAPDPILDGISRAFGGAFANYARNELGFKTEMTYQLLAGDVTHHWDWKGGRQQEGIEGDLRVLLSFDPSFRVLIAHGYADLVTPYAETRYILEHMPAFTPPGRIALKLYRGGHMIYLDPDSRQAFTADAAALYRASESNGAAAR